MRELNRGRMLPSAYGGAHQMPSRDLRIARLLEDCYRAELGAVAAYTYRSLVTEPRSRELADLFDRIAVDETEHFLLLGRLICALGGDPVIQTRVHTVSLAREAREEKMLCTALCEERAEVDRYQTVMGRVEDRIVRSFLSQIISDEERHIREMQKMM